MPASNITSVVLNGDGSVTIEGQVTQINDHTVTLLHVWLAATGDPDENGAGLAIDCLNEGQKGVKFDGENFTITNAKGAAAKGAPPARFSAGQATASAIAVSSPKDTSAGPPAVVIQWSRTLKLVTDEKR
jgi:hypothetical protein